MALEHLTYEELLLIRSGLATPKKEGGPDRSSFVKKETLAIIESKQRACQHCARLAHEAMSAGLKMPQATGYADMAILERARAAVRSRQDKLTVVKPRRSALKIIAPAIGIAALLFMAIGLVVESGSRVYVSQGETVSLLQENQVFQNSSGTANRLQILRANQVVARFTLETGSILTVASVDSGHFNLVRGKVRAELADAPFASRFSLGIDGFVVKAAIVAKSGVSLDQPLHWLGGLLRPDPRDFTSAFDFEAETLSPGAARAPRLKVHRGTMAIAQPATPSARPIMIAAGQSFSPIEPAVANAKARALPAVKAQIQSKAKKSLERIGNAVARQKMALARQKMRLQMSQQRQRLQHAKRSLELKINRGKALAKGKGKGNNNGKGPK